jgi:hypothetical protein
VWKIIIKCADLGHCMKPVRLHKRWAYRVMHEMYCQVRGVHLSRAVPHCRAVSALLSCGHILCRHWTLPAVCTPLLPAHVQPITQLWLSAVAAVGDIAPVRQRATVLRKWSPGAVAPPVAPVVAVPFFGRVGTQGDVERKLGTPVYMAMDRSQIASAAKSQVG